MKTILIDCRFAALHAGLGRYTRELVIHLLQRPAQLRYVLLVRDKKEEWIPGNVDTVEADIAHYSLREQIVLPNIIRSVAPDLLFSPHFNVPFLCPVPFIVTVHDLILHRYPNRASLMKQILYRSIIGRAVKKAEAIVAVSSFTGQELDDTYGPTVAEKTRIILEGVSDVYRPVTASASQKILERHGVRQPYFLYVGNAKQHKNVQVLIDAFHQAALPDAELLLISGGSEVQTLRLPPHVRILSRVTDADLPALYSAARAFVTASLYEGYCLPVAEALACGCPVIASNRTAIPETAAGHAMLVEPTVDAFITAFQNPPVERRPFIVGTWERAAEETHMLMQRICS